MKKNEMVLAFGGTTLENLPTFPEAATPFYEWYIPIKIITSRVRSLCSSAWGWYKGDSGDGFATVRAVIVFVMLISGSVWIVRKTKDFILPALVKPFTSSFLEWMQSSPMCNSALRGTEIVTDGLPSNGQIFSIATGSCLLMKYQESDHNSRLAAFKKAAHESEFSHNNKNKELKKENEELKSIMKSLETEFRGDASSATQYKNEISQLENEITRLNRELSIIQRKLDALSLNQTNADSEQTKSARNPDRAASKPASPPLRSPGRDGLFGTSGTNEKIEMTNNNNNNNNICDPESQSENKI